MGNRPEPTGQDDEFEALMEKYHQGTPAERAIAIAFCRTVDGDHHKMWVIDQMVRILAGDSYEKLVAMFENVDEDGEPEYEWETGIAP